MVNRSVSFVTAMVLLLGVSAIAEAGRFRCRGRWQSCPRHDSCPVDYHTEEFPRHRPPVYTGAGTVEQLATSVAKAALTVNRQQNLDAKTKEALLAEFEFQIGPVARDPTALAALLADGVVDRKEIQTSIGGEIKDISNRLRQR